MKKFVLFLMMAVLALCVAVPALADVYPGEEATVSLHLSNTNAAYVSVKASYDTSVFTLVGYDTSVGQGGRNGVVVYDLNGVASGTIGSVTLRVNENAAPGTYIVDAVLTGCYDVDENNATASVSGGSVTVASKATAAPTVEPTAAPTVEPTAAPTVEPTAAPVIKNDWRYNQTVCSLGIRFRDINPSLTDKWNMFTPIDLSQDGVQKIDLIAGNALVIGSVTVEVCGDSVTVTYKISNAAEKRDMAFTILPDLDSVTGVDIAKLPSFTFGKSISIANDLNGDTNVLLYVVGHADCDFMDARNEYFSANGKNYLNTVAQLKALLEKN